MSWIIPASVTFICWGVWSFIPKFTARHISPMSAIVYETIGAIIMGFVALSITGFQAETNATGVLLGVITGMLGITGALGFLYAVRSGKITIISMFASMSPIITIILAFFFLKEPITLMEGIGLSCAFFSLYCFSSKS